MTKPPLSHFSPKFANKTWADASGFISYFSSPYSLAVKKASKGRKQWGRKRGLYTWEVEHALDHQLENKAGLIYEKILTFDEITYDERKLWAQFILSQLVRTPSYIKYEKKAKEILYYPENPVHDRVWCQQCGEIYYIANRDWCLLLAHEDDFFVRSDNPVFQTGFIERPETCLFYPISPKICLVICSMPADWSALTHQPRETCGYKLDKGFAHFYNFNLVKGASESLIISPEHDGGIAEVMFGDMLGAYPQPPFLLHTVNNPNNSKTAFESIRILMSKTDKCEYPNWQPNELEPFYQQKSISNAG